MRLIILFLSLIVSVAFGQSNRGKAIICLTYDDGLNTQLSTVIPQLDSVGLKATFFLNAINGSSQSDRIGQTPEAVIGWTNAARHGHELGNHTLFHPCPEKLGWEKSVAIDQYTVERLLKELTVQNSLLSFIDPVRKERSYAYPCNNQIVEGIDYSDILVRKGLVKYARTGGDSTSIITDFASIKPMNVPSWHVWTGTTLPQLIAFAEKVKRTHGLGVYQFHGVGAQVFQITPEVHRAFLDYLKSNDKYFEVMTFSGAMDKIAATNPRKK